MLQTYPGKVFAYLFVYSINIWLNQKSIYCLDSKAANPPSMSSVRWVSLVVPHCDCIIAFGHVFPVRSWVVPRTLPDQPHFCWYVSVKHSKQGSGGSS